MSVSLRPKTYMCNLQPVTACCWLHSWYKLVHHQHLLLIPLTIHNYCKRKDTCTISMTEVWTFVTHTGLCLQVIYCTQLCLIYTKSISDKDSTSSARWKRICEYMWEMHLPWHSNKVQLKPQLSYGFSEGNSRILQFWHWNMHFKPHLWSTLPT